MTYPPPYYSAPIPGKTRIQPKIEVTYHTETLEDFVEVVQAVRLMTQRPNFDIVTSGKTVWLTQEMRLTDASVEVVIFAPHGVFTSDFDHTDFVKSRVLAYLEGSINL